MMNIQPGGVPVALSQKEYYDSSGNSAELINGTFSTMAGRGLDGCMYGAP